MSEPTSVNNCRLIELSKINDDRGSLTFIEGKHHIPFDIHRIYYLYDTPADSQRAGHAHRHCFQFLIALTGSFSIHLDDGLAQQSVLLDHPWQGLLITPMIWFTIDRFSPGAVCLVLASEKYDQSGYCRDYDDFLKAVRQ